MRKLLVSLALAAASFGSLAVPAVAYAQTPTPTPPVQTTPTPPAEPTDIQQNLCAGVNLDLNSTCNQGGITDQQARDKMERLFRQIINLFSIVVGFVSVIMIIIGGLKYITSGGDSSNITGAKNTIIYAIIGIIIVALSQFIVKFVLTRVIE